MANVYTIIDFFSVDDYGEPDQCWVANFSEKENAILAFESKLRETKVLDADGKVVVDLDKDVRKSARELFEEMLTGGFCYVSINGSQTDKWFVRGEEIQTYFNEEKISWQ